MTTDQSRPVSRASVVEALTQIRALCDRVEMPGADGIQYVAIESVRAVLDAVSVDATPAQGIDRDALIARLQSINWGNSATRIDRDRFWGECGDAVLALVRPVEGVVLSPEEARRVVGWLDMSNLVPEDDDLALVNRLETSS